MKKIKISLLCLFALLLISSGLQAHTINYDFSGMSKTAVGWVYLQMGFTHILPLGLDHILFVLGLYLLSPKLKTVLIQATAFTVAHSLTLGLAIFGFIHPLSSVIEPIIALSIVFIAVENIALPELKSGRLVIVFLFGLIHGCGFASALTEVGLPEKNYLVALLTFNLGVELGQVTVLISAFLLFGKWFGEKVWYRKRIVIPLSIIIGCIAMYWTIERAFLIG